jgi:hypothetical protein
MFPSTSILQHYIEFNTCTIVTLKKLLNVASFGGFINHLAHRHAILLASLGWLSLPFIVWTIAPAFLQCWAIFALIIRFYQDDHLTFLGAITHAKIGTSPL